MFVLKNETVQEIANAIRAQTNTTDSMRVKDMAEKIREIQILLPIATIEEITSYLHLGDDN